MGTQPIILEISSDEDEDWLSDLLGRVNQESDSFDDVVVVDEEVSCAPVIQKNKFMTSNGIKGSGTDSDDDCLILDGDPDRQIAVVDDTRNGTDELLIVGEKGQCHCYVCDLRAPCIHWGTGVSSSDHCHSTDKEKIWREQRKHLKQGNIAATRTQEVLDTALSITPPHTTSVPALPLTGSGSVMALPNPPQYSVSNSNCFPAFSTALDRPNIISQRHTQCPRPLPVRNRSPLYLNGVNRERRGDSTMGLLHVASHQKFKRAGSPGISLSLVNQSEYNSSNSPQTPVPPQLSFQNQPELGREDYGSWQDLLDAASFDSSGLGTFVEYSPTSGNCNSTNSQVHVQLQVHDQPFLPLNVKQSASQSVNPTAGATNSDLLERESNFNWFNADSDDIGQRISALEPMVLPTLQPSGPSAISQHHSTSPDSWLFSIDRQPVPGILTDPACSDLCFDSLEPPMVDPALLF